MKSPARATATSIQVASTPDLKRVTGRYFASSKPERSSKRSDDRATAVPLWRASAEPVDLT